MRTAEAEVHLLVAPDGVSDIEPFENFLHVAEPFDCFEGIRPVDNTVFAAVERNSLKLCVFDGVFEEVGEKFRPHRLGF